MADSNSKAIKDAVQKFTSYVSENYSSKSTPYYKEVLEGLAQYANGDERNPTDVIASYYKIVTGKPAFQRPETKWLRLKARVIFMLLDIVNGNELKRIYTYNATEYSGVFVSQLASFTDWQREIGNSNGTIREKRIYICEFLRFLEDKGVASPKQITVNHILSYLQYREKVSAGNKWHVAYALRSFLTSPIIRDELDFAPEPLLCGFRQKPNNRLKSFYAPDELKKVMDAVDRTTAGGKTIYAMMLLACVYGLRVSDIRELQQSSVRWQARKIQLFQKKTKRYVELPMTEAVKFALLDYLKNVRPDSPDPHFFIRHLRPHIPYSDKDNFGSKVAAYFRAAGINTDRKHFGMHSLRFSLATELLAEGVPINEISSILGHKNIKATKEYAWSDIKHLRIAALEVPLHAR